MQSKEEFSQFILLCILCSRDVYGDDNVDSTYPAPGFGADPDATRGEQLNYLTFVLAHCERLYNALSLLEDPESRSLLLSLILFRILTYRRIRIPVNREKYSAAHRSAAAVKRSEPTVKAGPIEMVMKHFELTHLGQTMQLDCCEANIRFSFFLRQYYFERHEIAIRPEKGDYVIDAGGCFGDTALEFALSVGREGHIYSFEPLAANAEIFRHNLAQNPDIANVSLITAALGEWDRKGGAGQGAASPSYSMQTGDTEIATRSLDECVQDGTIPRVDFIKMDIEGHELAALRGARSTIFRFRPKLAISIYHKRDDYFCIPEFLNSLGLGYRFYLENYTMSEGETILYASGSGQVGPGLRYSSK